MKPWLTYALYRAWHCAEGLVIGFVFGGVLASVVVFSPELLVLFVTGAVAVFASRYSKKDVDLSVGSVVLAALLVSAWMILPHVDRQATKVERYDRLMELWDFSDHEARGWAINELDNYKASDSIRRR